MFKCCGEEEKKTKPMGVETNLKASVNKFQKARPWDNDDIMKNLSEPNELSMSDVFKGKRVVVFGVPCPFTGTCSNAHYPPYKKLASDFKSTKNVDEIICYTVSDPYSMYNWAEKLENDFDEITFMTDPVGEFAKEYELDRDYGFLGIGFRAARFSMFVDDGVVKVFNLVEEEKAQEDAEKLFEQIDLVKAG